MCDKIHQLRPDGVIVVPGPRRRRMMGKCVKTKPRSVMFRECSLQDRLSPTPVQTRARSVVLEWFRAGIHMYSVESKRFMIETTRD